MIDIREYRETDRDSLIAVLKRNVPRYFAESDIAAFEQYLRGSGIAVTCI
jgi:hypothetical protein